MTTEDAPAATKRTEGGGRYAAATFILIGAVSSVSQMAAVASLGLPVSWSWSTGGLVALISSIWMWIQCRSWAAWRKWAWVPVIITVVIAFVTINLMASNAERAAAEEHAAMCAAAKQELDYRVSQHEKLLDEAYALSYPWGDRPADWKPVSNTSTTRDWASEAVGGWGAGSATLADPMAFYTSSGGPDMEASIRDFQADYFWECVNDDE